MQFFIGPEPRTTDYRDNPIHPHISTIIYPHAYGQVYSHYLDGPKDGQDR